MSVDPQNPSDPDTASFDEQAINRARDILKSAPEPFKAAPETVGAYRILEKLGQGGMGEVYRAEQRTPIRREVALKLIKLGMDTKQVIARFSAERQALAMMDHPNIAKVFDAGTDETGRPYFVMEYVKGKPITEYADEKQLSLDDRLKLFEQVCHAIQHAHHKGVIHRDLKPSNVLVSTQDGRPHAKVIDFGIAKAMNQPLTDMTLFTEHALMVGTPAYMSPEQAEGNIDIDTRSDVYSLGVLLYELLTGHTPFDPQRLRKAAIMEVARILRDEEPPKPSTRISAIDNVPPRSAREASPSTTPTSSNSNTSKLASLAKARCLAPESYAKHLRGELDWIVMKALEKDRTRRYTTPADFAEDIQRHLEGIPIEAAPPDLRYRISKFVRKHRLPTAAAALVTFLIFAGLAATTWQWRRAEQNAYVALLQKAEAEQLRSAAESEKKEARRSQRIAEETSNFLSDILMTKGGRYADKTTVLEAMNTAAAQLEFRLKDDPIVHASACFAIGRSYSQIGRWDTSRRFLEKSLPVFQKELGASHPRTIRTITELASVCLSMEDVEAAERYCFVALNCDKATKDSPDRRIVRKIAQLKLVQNDPRGAESVILQLLEVLEINPANLSREELQKRSLFDVEMLLLLGTLSNCKVHKGEIDEAERLAFIGTDFYEPLDTYPVQKAWAQADLGRVKLARGVSDQAEVLLMQALPTMEKRFGRDHFRVQWLINDLALAQAKLGRALTETQAYRAIDPPLNPPLIRSDVNANVKSDVMKEADSKPNRAFDFVGKQVQIVGRVAIIKPTATKGRLNIVLEPADSGVIVYLPTKELVNEWVSMTKNFPPESLIGIWLDINGRLEIFGGRDQSFLGHPQVTISDLRNIKILDSKEEREFLITSLPEPEDQKRPTAVAKPAASELVQAIPNKGLKMIAWNLESGQSNPVTIAGQILAFSGTHLFGFSEVDPGAFTIFRDAIEEMDSRMFASIDAKSGDEDRLQVVFDAERLELLETKEPNEMAGVIVNPGNVRSPLICLFQDRVTKQRFYTVLVHQARGNEALRNEQAKALREWARDQSTAVIAMGDFNYDFEFTKDRGNVAFVELNRDNVLSWVRPEKLIESNWSDKNNDLVNDFPNQLLDGFFVAGPAKTWQPKSRVIVRDGDFPDTDQTSDHRPSELVFVPAP